MMTYGEYISDDRLWIYLSLQTVDISVMTDGGYICDDRWWVYL